MKLALCAGEVSGDLYGALLARAIQQQMPAVELIGTGGERMAAAGVRPVARLPFGTMGVTGVVRRLPAYARSLRTTVAALRTESPDAVVLIDNPGFNLRIAAAVGRDLPCFYYIPPKVWAHGYGRVRLLRRYVRQVIPIFPFEEAIYRREGIPCRWFGHPIVDLIDATGDVDGFLRACGLRRDAPVVGLLPGSREEELHALLPVFTAIVRNLRVHFPQMQAVVSCADSRIRQTVDRCLAMAKSICLSGMAPSTRSSAAALWFSRQAAR